MARQALTRPCPNCQATLDRLGNSAYFRCPGCGLPFILEEGRLRQTRGRRGRLPKVTAETVEKPEPAMAWWEVEKLAGWQPVEELIR